MLWLRFLLAGLIALLIGASPAAAQIKVFLCSADVPGESNDTDFLGCNELIAVGEKVEFLAEGADKVANTLELLPIEIRKAVDLGSPILRMLALTKQRFDGVISFRRDGDVNFVFLEVNVQGARVVNIGFDENGVAPTEDITIVPERITWTYTMQKNDNSAGEKTEFSWDVKSDMSL